MSKIYFASDFHLGAPDAATSLDRERRILRWLDTIKADAGQLFLVGDIFDFWFEYRHVVPKGYVRFLGKLAELADAGIQIHFFTGNHDMWAFSYLQDEIGVHLYRQPQVFELHGRRFLVGHGDGLGPAQRGFKLLRAVFHHKAFQWFFARFHPNFSFAIAHFWSASSRNRKPRITGYKGDATEYLVAYVEQKARTLDVDFFVFGHRHLPIDYAVQSRPGARYLNLGEWFQSNSYAVFDGDTMEIRYFEQPQGHLANR